MREKSILISLIVPVFNEEHCVEAFLDEVDRQVPEEENLTREIVFVDDGSTDGTVDRLAELKQTHEGVRIICLSRNFGKEAALTAGLDHCRGDVAVPIDVDLQEPPALIRDFLREWRNGYDVVYAVRADRRSDGLLKRSSAGAFYRVFNRISQTRIPPNVGDFRLLDRRVVEEVCRLRERSRFMKGLLNWPGFKATGVSFDRPARSSGQSGWGFLKLWRLALDGIFSFSSAPLKVWAYVGLLISLVSMVYGLYIVGLKLIYGIDVPGYSSIIVAVTVLGGLQLMSLGIIGEYLSRIFDEIKQRPIYVVDRIVE
ncbi:MAG: glycosyltransferase family 2 protein [Phycisphaerae bacterium]